MAERRFEITGDDQWSTGLEIGAGYFTISITGTFVMTITTQFSENGGTSWTDIEDFTEAGRWTGIEGSGMLIRVGCKSGNYTSGTATIKIKE